MPTLSHHPLQCQKPTNIDRKHPILDSIQNPNTGIHIKTSIHQWVASIKLCLLRQNHSL